jgi:hypothetical protein
VPIAVYLHIALVAGTEARPTELFLVYGWAKGP